MSQKVDIKSISKKEIKRFIKFPWTVYKNDPNWVPPLISERRDFLDPSKNPFFEHADVQFFMAFYNGEEAGRIAAILDKNYVSYTGENAGLFGFFETIPNYDVAKALFSETILWLKDKGVKKILGPINLSTNYECGLLIEGFQYPPTLMMPYNPPYYKDYIEKFGFSKAKDLFAYFVDFREVDESKLKGRFLKVLERKGVSVRQINLSRFLEEAEKIREIYQAAWQYNWGFVPPTEKEFLYIAKSFKEIALPELSLVVEIDGKPVAFSLFAPDINQVLKKMNGRLFPFGIIKWFLYRKKIDLFRGIAFGVSREYKNSGLDLFLYTKIGEKAKEKGYFKWEISWVLEDNAPVNNVIRKRLGAKLYKKYRIFVKDI